MEIVVQVVTAIVFGTAGFAVAQWQIWRGRAISLHRECSEISHRLDRSGEMFTNLEDERKLQHEAMNTAFDYLNEHHPFGSHDDGLMEIRAVLLHAIQNSTYGRGQ